MALLASLTGMNARANAQQPGFSIRCRSVSETTACADTMIPQDTVVLRFWTVRERSGLAIPNARVSFSATDGSVHPSAMLTDAHGSAVATRTGKPTDSGTVMVYAFHDVDGVGVQQTYTLVWKRQEDSLYVLPMQVAIGSRIVHLGGHFVLAITYDASALLSSIPAMLK